jgi:hypothetical protein
MARKILDSGNRTEFESGAVRDMREGKGRCDLLPLDVVSKLFNGGNSKPDVFTYINEFQKEGKTIDLFLAMSHFIKQRGWTIHTMLLELARHFEEGSKKYGDNNWRRGIPVRYYIDSALRHYIKWLRSDEDEPHDRAFCWNIICAIWTCENIPELNDYAKGDENEDN